MQKKKNTVVFIDAESVSSNHCGRIMSQCSVIGELDEARYYARQKDPATRAWNDEANQRGIKKYLISGSPAPNKIDKHIIKDAKKLVKTRKNIDIFCIASRDGDYTELVRYLRNYGKRVVVLATKCTSQRLKSAASIVLEI